MMDSMTNRIFLSYASEDLLIATKVYEGLKKRGLDVWFDKECLMQGKWKQKIQKAIARSRYFVICISKAALRKIGDDRPGFQDEELNWAYSIADAQPDREFTIIPIRIEACDRGDFRLSSFQQYELFNDFEIGLDRLSVNIGGVALRDPKLIDTRTEKEKIIDTVLGKAEVAFYADDLEKAFHYYSLVLELDTKSFTVLCKRASVQFRLEHYKEALIDYENAQRINQDDKDIYYEKHKIFYILRRHEEALEAIEMVLLLSTKKDNLWNDYGSALYQVGRLNDSLESYSKALEIFPNSSIIWSNKGLVLSKMQHYDEALKAYEKAIELDQKNILAWNGKGCVLVELGKHLDAMIAFVTENKLKGE